jgi:hypothetical protein
LGKKWDKWKSKGGNIKEKGRKAKEKQKWEVKE